MRDDHPEWGVGIKLTHLPTGITVYMGNYRTRAENYDWALRLLRAKVYAESHPLNTGIGQRTYKPAWWLRISEDLQDGR